MALAPDGEGVGLIAAVQALNDLGLAMPWAELVAGPAQFWAAPPQRAYAQAGALLRYIEADYGIAAVARLYGQGDFAAATGLSLAELGRALEIKLAATPRVPAAMALARGAMQRGSIFAYRCAHEVAVKRERACRAPSAAAAVALWREIVTDSGGDIDDRLSETQSQLHTDADGRSAARSTLALLRLRQDLTAAQASRRALLAVQADAGDANWPAVARGANALMAEEGGHPAAHREAWAWRLAATAPPALRCALVTALSGRAGPRQVTCGLTEQAKDVTAAYLLGRSLWAEGDNPGALGVLEAMGPHPYPPIESERLRLCALAAMRAGDPSQGLWAAQRMAAIAQLPGDVAWAQDMAARAQVTR